MKNNTKIMSLLLAFALIGCSFAACGKNKYDSGVQKNHQQSENKSDDGVQESQENHQQSENTFDAADKKDELEGTWQLVDEYDDDVIVFENGIWKGFDGVGGPILGEGTYRCGDDGFIITDRYGDDMDMPILIQKDGRTPFFEYGGDRYEKIQ